MLNILHHTRTIQVAVLRQNPKGLAETPVTPARNSLEASLFKHFTLGCLDRGFTTPVQTTRHRLPTTASYPLQE
jgi:hypothetical protein